MAKPSWISVSPANGTNNGSFDVTANDNYINPARKGVVTVTGGGINKTIDVSQKSNRLILQLVQQATTYSPTKVIDTYSGKEYNLISSNKYAAEINTDFGAIIQMTYPGINAGPVDFMFRFSIDIDEIQLGMDDGSGRPSYVKGKISSDSKVVLLHLGNGYPEISNTKLILSIKAGIQTMSIYYTNGQAV